MVKRADVNTTANTPCFLSYKQRCQIMWKQLLCVGMWCLYIHSGCLTRDD